VLPTLWRNLAVLLALAAPPGGQGEKPALPKPVERDGLAVTIKPGKEAFAPDEPVTFEVVFKNISDEPIRLPDQPQDYKAWIFHVTRAGVKRALIGRSVAPPGKPAKPKPTAALTPGSSLAVTVRLDGQFAFSQSPWDPKKAVRRLPEGRYRLRAEIRFPRLPRPDKNPARVWPVTTLLTRPAEFVIGEPDQEPAKPQAAQNTPCPTHP
jgi:hypothetical protein